MTYLPSEPGGALATRDDIAQLSSRLGRRLEQIDHRFEVVEDRFHLVRDDLRDQMRFYTVTTVAAMTSLAAIYAFVVTLVT